MNKLLKFKIWSHAAKSYVDYSRSLVLNAAKKGLDGDLINYDTLTAARIKNILTFLFIPLNYRL